MAPDPGSRRDGDGPALAAWLAAGSVPGAVLGALMASRVSDAWLRRGFGVYLLAVAAYAFFHPPRGDS